MNRFMMLFHNGIVIANIFWLYMWQLCSLKPTPGKHHIVLSMDKCSLSFLLRQRIFSPRRKLFSPRRKLFSPRRKHFSPRRRHPRYFVLGSDTRRVKHAFPDACCPCWLHAGLSQGWKYWITLTADQGQELSLCNSRDIRIFSYGKLLRS